jgi:hypothetical protein
MQSRFFLVSLSAICLTVYGADAAENCPPRQRPSASRISGRTGDMGSRYDYLRTYYRLENDGTGYKDVAARIYVLNETGARSLRDIKFKFRPASEHLEIPYLRILKSDGDQIEVITGAVEHLERREAYTDYKSLSEEKTIALPPLSPGDEVEYEVKNVFDSPSVPGQFWIEFWFQFAGAINEALAIDIPESRPVRVGSRSWLKVRIIQVHRRRIFHYQASLKLGLGTASTDSIPDVALTSFVNWKQVGQWYSDLEQSHRGPSPEIRVKANELTSSLNRDLDKVEALYNYVAQQIKYSDLASLDIGGYEPHSASDTLLNGFGDCKDKAMLLASLLEAVGMHASSVLISDHQDAKLGLPSPLAFNHLITILCVGGEDIWMDPSSPVMPFRMLTYSLRDKQALVVVTGASHMVRTPPKAWFPNMWTEQIEAELTDTGTLAARIRIVARGDSELQMRQAFLTVAAPVQIAFIRRAILKESGGRISDISMSDPLDTHDAFTLSFRFRSDRYIRETRERSVLTLPATELKLPVADDDCLLLSESCEPEREIVSTGEYRYEIKLKLPSRLKPDVPESLSISKNFGSYSVTYAQAGNTLTVERNLIVLQDELPGCPNQDYRYFRERVLVDSQQGFHLKPDGSNSDGKETR